MGALGMAFPTWPTGHNCPALKPAPYASPTMRKTSIFAVTCACKREIELPNRPGLHACPHCGRAIQIDWRPLTIQEMPR